MFPETSPCPGPNAASFRLQGHHCCDLGLWLPRPPPAFTQPEPVCPNTHYRRVWPDLGRDVLGIIHHVFFCAWLLVLSGTVDVSSIPPSLLMVDPWVSASHGVHPFPCGWTPGSYHNTQAIPSARCPWMCVPLCSCNPLPLGIHQRSRGVFVSSALPDNARLLAGGLPLAYVVPIPGTGSDRSTLGTMAV